MTETSAPSADTRAAEYSPADDMDTGLLRRGDAKLSLVAVGGSAGSIAALQKFFAAMSADSGMAFVVILHLSKHHESTLAELLQRSTAMPVVAVTDGITVEPNNVYVIPPGKLLASADGHLSLTDAEEPHGKRVAVDCFFRTLADTHGAQSVAVVLSGAGADGALGLKRIKELGGLTIAQDPDEAEHPDMPRAAIATGVVDWVLGVEEMPAKLLAYVKQRGALRLPGEDAPNPAEAAEHLPDQQEAALRDVLAFLHTRTGRDFSCYKRATILRRIARRMRLNGLADLSDYLLYMRTHAGEAGALLQDLLISVTNFFRDPASFAALERTLPELFRGKGPGDTVRVWVAGCATGEEAYAVAILLSEHAAQLVGPPQLQVFATDLDEEVIREAREGVYPETIAGDVSEERLRHFFIHQQGGYRVRRAVRELVLFAPHDLLKDSPFSRLDLVSCRNLLIYLKREAQRRAFDIFHFALRPGGRLFLGTSEAVDEGSPLFAVLDKKHRLYTQLPGPQRLIAVPSGPGTLARALALQERARERPTVPGNVALDNLQGGLDPVVPFDRRLPPGELHYRLIERFSPPSILVNALHDIVHLSDSAGRFLQFSGGEPTRNLLRAVHPMLRVELRAALYAAAQTRTVAKALRVPLEMGGAVGGLVGSVAGSVSSLVDIRVTPAGDLAPDFLLVVLEEHPADGADAVALPRDAHADHAALHLERELVATKAQLRDTIAESEASTQELKASNEELQAMNEELRSATEELETSREELQSVNEELTTVNDELKSNVDQLSRSNNDLQNLMAATDIATIFLDRELRIQRFTPSAKALFNFIASDLGRPLSDLSHQLDYPEIVADAERSLLHLQTAQREVSAGEQWYLARAVPYRTADDHIAGVVLTFLNITERKRAEEEIARLAAYSERQRRVYETVLTNTPDFMYVFSLDHRVLYANDALITMWGRGHEGAIGKTFLEIGYEPWHAEMHAREIDQVRATRQPIRGEVPFSGTNGRRQYDYIFVPVIGADGEVEAVAGTTRDVTERKQAEQQLRDGQEQLDFALAAADLGQWALNLADHTASRTLRHDQIFGYDTPLAQWTYELFLDHVLPADRAAVDADFQRSVATGSAWAVECRIRRADGAVRHIWAKGHVRRDAEGQVDRMLGIIADTTDRRQAEQRQAFQIRLAEALRPLCDAADVQAESSRLLGEHLGANRVVYFEVLGDEYVIERDYTAGVRPLAGRYPVAAFGPALLAVLLQGRTVVEADATTEPGRPPDERAAFAAIQVRGHVDVPLIKGGRFVGGMTVHLTDRRHWTRQEVALIEDTAERTWAALERVRAEAALRQSEARLAFVRRSSGVGFWYCDLPFDVLQWDDLVKEHFHLPPEAVVTIDTFYDRIHADDREPTRQAIEHSIANRTHYNVDYRTVNPHTVAVRWVRAIGRTFYAADGTPTRFDGVTLDVSDQKTAEASLRESEQRLREADRRKDEFLATLAHELRNPLAPIRSGLQVIQRVGAEGAIEQARSMMERQVLQMTRLVDDLLDVSRLTTGKLELRTERLQLAEVIAAALETSRPGIDQQGHRLTVVLPDEPIYVDGDAIRLAQVVSNLVNNSAKYTHPGGHIRVSVSRDEATAVLAVADDGIGIPAPMLETVFGMFTQVDRTLEKTTGGLGVGLSLVKGVVQMHGGTIEAFSEGDGKGSEFAVRLPVAASTVGEPEPASEPGGAVVAAAAEAVPGPGLARPRRILIVDDNTDAADALAQLLELLGNEVLTAYDGESGIQAARAFQPGVMLCDIGMPKMNGYDTARSIRAEAWGKPMVLVALTGWSQGEDLRKSAEAGFDHHLVKPVEVDALLALLERVQPGAG